jgi:late competence protein required for DNA uptake (superfamily II DNA/RNA helicase)
MSFQRARCFNHGTREAIARCLSCGRSYCRECITEHRGRLRCAQCLAAEESKRERSKSRRRAAFAWTLGMVCFVASHFLIQATGSALGRIPSSFHDGSELLRLIREP